MQILLKGEASSEAMGEVRTEVTLTNATDRVLVRRGKLAPRDVHMYTADALVDTGAVRTVLPAHVVQQLDLAIRAQRVVELADGRKETVGVTEPVEINPAHPDQPVVKVKYAETYSGEA